MTTKTKKRLKVVAVVALIAGACGICFAGQAKGIVKKPIAIKAAENDPNLVFNIDDVFEWVGKGDIETLQFTNYEIKIRDEFCLNLTNSRSNNWKKNLYYQIMAIIFGSPNSADWTIANCSLNSNDGTNTGYYSIYSRSFSALKSTSDLPNENGEIVYPPVYYSYTITIYLQPLLFFEETPTGWGGNEITKEALATFGDPQTNLESFLTTIINYSDAYSLSPGYRLWSTITASSSDLLSQSNITPSFSFEFYQGDDYYVSGGKIVQGTNSYINRLLMFSSTEVTTPKGSIDTMFLQSTQYVYGNSLERVFFDYKFAQTLDYTLNPLTDESEYIYPILNGYFGQSQRIKISTDWRNFWQYVGIITGLSSAAGEEAIAEYYNRGYSSGYDAGNQAGYDRGYSEGYAEAGTSSSLIDIIVRKPFQVIQNVMTVEILPGFQLWYVIGIPLVFFILKFLFGFFI